MQEIRVSPREAVGKGYREFWEFTGRYRIVKGGRGSKKSTTAALWIIYQMMFHFHAYGVKPNTLVLRRYDKTNRDSTFSQLQWAINRLSVPHLWKSTTSPLALSYRPSGQVILFRGVDDPQSITSIVTSEGNLCWCWWEEAFQITNESDFDKVDLSLRGKLPEQLFCQHTLTMNPWSDKHWIKPRFFDKKSDNILAITRNYDCNEFLSEADHDIFKTMKIDNPRRYAIEGMGAWGISEGLVYENWEEREFNWLEKLRRAKQQYKAFFGLDFGFTNDPTAFVAVAVEEDKREIYICAEFYKTRLLNRDIASAIKGLGFERERIAADSSDPKSISELNNLGIFGVYGAKKGPDSVNSGIQRLQSYRIIVHPSCQNAIIELSNYVWARERFSGRLTNSPVDAFNHLLDALRYATESLNERAFRWG